MDPQIQPRQTAYIVQIKDLLSGTYVKEEGWNPNYVTISNKNVSRINIIGVITNNDESENVQNMTIEDGTGKINIRNFEKKIPVQIGDTVHLIGKVREYGNEKYITPEIIKKIDGKWSVVWKKLALKGEEPKQQIEEVEIAIEEVEENPKTQIENILSKIRELDSGDGANYEDIIKITGDEKIISNLLLQGEIFEIRPGKIKVLD